MSFDATHWTQGKRRIHLIGIAGSGMSPLADIFVDLGHEVTGSDVKEAPERLRDRGVRMQIGHRAENLGKAEVVIASAAIPDSNAEWAEAGKRGLPRLRRTEVLAQLASHKKLVAVLGSHGKTTTSTMLAHIWKEAGQDPCFYLGGYAPSLGASGAWKSGAWLVAEVDESEGAPAQLKPAAAILLNADHEHADRYPDEKAVVEAYKKVLGQVSGPLVVVAKEEKAAMEAAGSLAAKKTFGWEKSGADYTGTWKGEDKDGVSFNAKKGSEDLGMFRVTAPGRHNAGNALGALALAREAGLDVEKIRKGLAAFRRADRRFEIVLATPELEVVDDYAHHPREVSATIDAAKARGRKRVVAVFQPHRHTRLSTFMEGFVEALARADAVVVLPVYSAGENAIEGSGSAVLATRLTEKKVPVELAGSMPEARSILGKIWQEGDLLLVMGAGDSTHLAHRLAAEAPLFLEVRRLVAGQGDVRWYEPMQKHTTIRIGGPAQVWFEPDSEEVLAKVVRHCSAKKIALTVIGRGSNLLVRDGGLPGVSVNLGKPGLSKIEAVDGKIRAGAGARLKQIVAAARAAGVGGLEFMEGIPGALGGAMRMNAGAMDSWTFEVVEAVRVMDRTGQVKEVPAAEFEVKYRKVPRLETDIAVGAVLKGSSVKPEEIAEKLKKYSRKRWDSQPAAPSAGCIFKNAATIPAGKLIDELGLKDTAVGGARISPVHGNFIVNQGGAKAADVLALMEKVRARAKADRGIELEPEVIVLGVDE
jgi:UDP-N-acetylmuramate--L-alanine ligase/UDP-N-acetylenolpyruvoylglucosamine reductase